MENYNNPVQAGLMMAQTLHKLRFGSPHQVKKYTASGGHDWLKAKEIWKKVVMITSYGPMTSSRKEDNNCHEHFLFVISVCVCVFFVPLKSTD